MVQMRNVCACIFCLQLAASIIFASVSFYTYMRNTGYSIIWIGVNDTIGNQGALFAVVDDDDSSEVLDWVDSYPTFNAFPGIKISPDARDQNGYLYSYCGCSSNSGSSCDSYCFGNTESGIVRITPDGNLQTFYQMPVDPLFPFPILKVDYSNSLGYISTTSFTPTTFHVFNFATSNEITEEPNTLTLQTNFTTVVSIFTVNNGILYAVMNESIIQYFNASNGLLLGSISIDIRGATQILADNQQNVYVTYDPQGNGFYHLDVFSIPNNEITFSEQLWMNEGFEGGISLLSPNDSNDLMDLTPTICQYYLAENYSQVQLDVWDSTPNGGIVRLNVPRDFTSGVLTPIVFGVFSIIFTLGTCLSAFCIWVVFSRREVRRSRIPTTTHSYQSLIDEKTPILTDEKKSIFPNIDVENHLKSKDLNNSFSRETSLNKDSIGGDDKVCVICLSRPNECAFVPCGHKSVCTKCSLELVDRKNQICPVCRKEFTQVIKIF